MSTARSHENSANNDIEEPSEHSSSSRSTPVSRSLNIRLNVELPIAAPTAGLRSRPIVRRTWPQGMSPPRQPQPQQPPRLPSPRRQPALIHEVGGPSTLIVGIPVGRLPPVSWERDYLSVECVRQLHDQGFEHEMHLHHHQNLMDQVISQLSATHIELHRARDLIEEVVWEIECLRMKVVIWGLIACVLFSLLLFLEWNNSMALSSDSSADESGYVTARLPCPRATYVTGPDPTRTIDLNLPDHPHKHLLGKCPMWLTAESSGTKSDACSPSATQNDLNSNATSPRSENTVSAPMRLERPKARTRENARKKTHLTITVTFRNLEIGEPSTKAPQVVTPRESTKEYVQLYGYFDWKDEVNESLGWLTSRGTDMKARLDFHTDLATDMSGQMNELEQDIAQNQERATTAIRVARTTRIQSRVAKSIALVVSIVSLFIQLYR
ncbi:hypothetical protein L1987_85796 [Smallanthus sonchifolius]|uniref:Uncharacterized protein n=1 Tax=Smallanthus sonchifolius TaxID=185202 RepID=A0ACB8XYR7_9ASTR|nr:hypothetical protein L1987_85796 [Smallanthus sonchifolius]